jgi:hypothetical protein
MSASPNNAAMALETRSAPPELPTPRFVVTIRDGSEFLLDAARTPLFYRRAPGLPSERVSPDARIKNVVSDRDLWPFGVHPRHDRGASWEIGRLLRLWGIVGE